MSFPSSNFNDRPEGTEIDTIVIHYTGMKSGVEAYERLCQAESEVSAHYIILEDGEIIPLVSEQKRAWHAGVSGWRGRENINDCSIGIELVNPGHEFGYQPFPEQQMESLIRLVEEICYRHPIALRNIVGHSDVAPSRKEDPGELFNWELLASYNLAMWPDMPADVTQNDLVKPGESGDVVKDLQARLSDFGYRLKVDGDYGLQTCYTVVAFQRRFTPTKIGDVWHEEADVALNQLLQQYVDI